jgi:beta-carotene 3-hydroxylase
MLFNFSVVFVTFWFMEFMAWFTHKFVMHGLLWFLHKDHHQVEPGFFEKNDSFFLIFAIPSAYCYVTGLMYHDFRLYIGIGISLYGFAYFIIHEIIIHQRFKLWSRLDNRYVKAIRRAHKIHHKYLGKEDGENFGMLIVPLKYWKNPNSTN